MPPSSLLLLLEHSQGHRLVRDLLYGAASVWALPLYPFHLGNRQTVETQRGVRSRGQMWSPPRLRPAPGPPPLPSRPGQTARVTAETTSCLFSSPLCLPFPPPGRGFLLGFATQNSTLLSAQLGAPGGARRRPGEAGSALQMTLGPPGRLSSRQGPWRIPAVGALRTPATLAVSRDSSGWDSLAPPPRTGGSRSAGLGAPEEPSAGLKRTSLETTA